MDRPVGTRLVITLVARGDDLVHAVPVGFRLVDEVFAEAGLRDPVSAAQTGAQAARLRILVRAIGREYRGRVALRVVELWTLPGLWLAVRYRLREFPCLLIAGHVYPIDTPVEAVIEALRQALAADPHDPTPGPSA
jgi:hypothetical protein